MSTSKLPVTGDQTITPPLSFLSTPPTSPPTDEKVSTQTTRVITLFKDIEAGRQITLPPWTEYQLAPGEYDEVELRLSRDKLLFGYVNDKIRYDYDGRHHRLFIRMPTAVHELFIDGVEDAIRSQLKDIRSGSDAAASFAQKVRPGRSTRISFPVDNVPHTIESKHEPDASFWHDRAQYPGVIIEVSYSQKRKRLARLAEDYLLDSDASVRVVVGLDIDYGNKGSQKATLSVWRTKVFPTASGDELRVVQEVADEAFRNEQGHPTDHLGLRLRLKDFAYEELAQHEIGDIDRELAVSTRQLCEYLSVAETKMQKLGPLGKHSITPGLKKRKRSETPPDQIASEDEARYAKHAEKATKRVVEEDPDYDDASVERSSD